MLRFSENTADNYYPNVAEAVSPFYVYNCLVGTETIEEIFHLQSTLNQPLQIASMMFRKWSMNLDQVRQAIPPVTGRGIYQTYCSPIIKQPIGIPRISVMLLQWF